MPTPAHAGVPADDELPGAADLLPLRARRRDRGTFRVVRTARARLRPPYESGDAMTDDELVQAFEAATLPPDLFSHAAHVRVAWWYLRRYSLPEGLLRFTAALRGFAAANGAPDRYHETVTVGYFLLIADRLT